MDTSRHVTNTHVITSTNITTHIKVLANERWGLIFGTGPPRQMLIFRLFGKHLVIFRVDDLGVYGHAPCSDMTMSGQEILL